MKTTKLNLPILTSLVIGNMIGTGIFLLPASLAAFGTISIFAWALTGFGAMFLALTFANLNQKIPKTGGPYVYCREAYGNFVGFLVAYTYWLSLWVATAGIAVSSIGYLGVIFKSLQPNLHPVTLFFIELGVVWFFTFVNIVGIRTAGILQVFLTLLKIIPLAMIIVFGLFKINWANFSEFNLSGTSHFSALTNAAALTVWAFIGLETATVPAENAQNSRDVYRATVYGTLITAVIYLLSTIVLMGLIPASILKTSTSPFADAATMIFGNNMAVFIAICAVIAGIGSLNVCTMLQGQIPLAAAQDRLFPTFFSKISRFGTPLRSFILSSLLVTIALVFTLNKTLMNQFNLLALLATLATLVTYFMCAMAEVKLLLQSDNWSKKILLKPLFIAVLAAGYSFWMMVGAGRDIIFYGTILLLTSFPIYFFIVTKKRKMILQG